MPWFQFTGDFNWHVPERKGAVTIAYKDGMTLLVREACAVDAEKAGKGRRYKKKGARAEASQETEAGDHHFKQVDTEPWPESDDAGG